MSSTPCQLATTFRPFSPSVSRPESGRSLAHLPSVAAPSDRAKEVHLSDIHAIVAENGECRGDMEKDVRNCDLHQVILCPDRPSACPSDLYAALARAFVLLGLHTFDEGQGLADTRADFTDRLLVVLVAWWGLSR